MLRCVKDKSFFGIFLLPGLWFAFWLKHGGVKLVVSKFVSPMAAGFANATLCCPSQGSRTKPRSLKDLEPALLTKSIWAQYSGQQLCSASQISHWIAFKLLYKWSFAQKVPGKKNDSRWIHYGGIIWAPCRMCFIHLYHFIPFHILRLTEAPYVCWKRSLLGAAAAISIKRQKLSCKLTEPSNLHRSLSVNRFFCWIRWES